MGPEWSDPNFLNPSAQGNIMPIPIILGATSVAATATAAVDYTLAYIAAGVTGGAAGGYYYAKSSSSEVLPSLSGGVEAISKKVHDEVGKLVDLANEKLDRYDEQFTQSVARLGASATRFASGLTAMESSTAALDEKVITNVAASKPRTETIKQLKKDHDTVKSDVAQQKIDTKSISTSLENLPKLRQVNQENKVLRSEVERLRAEKEGYASRAEKLSTLSKEKELENEQLKSKVSGYDSRMKDVIAIVKEQKSEIDALRNEMNSDKNKENSRSSAAFFGGPSR